MLPTSAFPTHMNQDFPNKILHLFKGCQSQLGKSGVYATCFCELLLPRAGLKVPQLCLESSWAQQKNSVASSRTQLSQSWLCFQEQGKHTESLLLNYTPPSTKLIIIYRDIPPSIPDTNSALQAHPKPLQNVSLLRVQRDPGGCW